jgi:hypothetical protein
MPDRDGLQHARTAAVKSWWPVDHDQPTPDQLQPCFDDYHAVASAGLVPPTAALSSAMIWSASSTPEF